jgi:hypothetical protein
MTNKLEKGETKMRRSSLTRALIAIVIFVWVLSFPTLTLTKETVQKWELVNPEGVIRIEPMNINPHPPTLEGRTVMLRWNGKHNGDNFLNRVAEMLTERVKDVKIIKSWEVAPETVEPITGSRERSMELMRKLAAFKPDLVIGSQAD